MNAPDSGLFDPPCRVMLRNKARAVITHALSGHMFTLLGNLEGDTKPETWKATGQWREDNKRHDLDIVALVAGNGELTAFTGMKITLGGASK